MTVQEYIDALLSGEVVPFNDAPKLSLAEYTEIYDALEAIGKVLGVKTETVVPEIKRPLGFYESDPKPYKRKIGYVAVKKWKG